MLDASTVPPKNSTPAPTLTARLQDRAEAQTQVITAVPLLGRRHRSRVTGPTRAERNQARRFKEATHPNLEPLEVTQERAKLEN